MDLKPLSANPIKWLNPLKQFVDKLPTNCLSVFDHFMGLALKGLNKKIRALMEPWIPEANLELCQTSIMIGVPLSRIVSG